MLETSDLGLCGALMLYLEYLDNVMNVVIRLGNQAYSASISRLGSDCRTNVKLPLTLP